MKFITLIAALLALSGCSDRQVYNSLKGAREYECGQIREITKRENCYVAARQSYNRYEAQQDR